MTRPEIEGDIAAARERLAGSISELIDQVHPRAVLSNTVSQAREFMGGEFQQAKAQVVDEGGVRMQRVALIVAAVGGAVGFVAVVRSIVRRR